MCAAQLVLELLCGNKRCRKAQLCDRHRREPVPVFQIGRRPAARRAHPQLQVTVVGVLILRVERGLPRQMSAQRYRDLSLGSSFRNRRLGKIFRDLLLGS